MNKKFFIVENLLSYDRAYLNFQFDDIVQIFEGFLKLSIFLGDIFY